MAGGRGDRGLYDGRNVSGVRMWLEVGDTEDSMVWLEVGKKEDCMMDAMCKEPGCVWK